MTIRVHHPDELAWRRVGDIEMGWMREHIDPTELEGHLAFHEPGMDGALQLMEMRLDADTLIAPHAHDADEIYFIAEGSLHWNGASLMRGGSLYIPADTPYSFRTGAEPARLLIFRATADNSFRPAS